MTLQHNYWWLLLSILLLPGKTFYVHPHPACSDTAQNHQEVLPLQLIGFTASVNKDIVYVRWTTSSEKNVNHFETEKSFDGIHFVVISKQTALGVNAGREHYLAEDFKPGPDINYYRLKVVSNNNGITYSKTVTLKHSR